MECDAKDCAFQMLNDDETVTSVQEEPDPLSTMKRMKTRPTTTMKVAMVNQMLTTKFLSIYENNLSNFQSGHFYTKIRRGEEY
ncbi:UNVERIFIED_CONTAM: hypothetical protein NCL1_34248 [Trichonephila clavipes]